jgi:hypothetical protein
MQPRVGESFHRAPLGLGSPNLEPDFKQFEQEGPLARLNLGRLPATPAGAFPSRPHNDYDLEQPKLLGPANPPPFPQQVEPNQMQLHRPQLDLGGPSFQAGAPHAPSINLALPEQQGADPSRVNVRPRPMTGIAQPTHAQALLQPQPQSTRTPFQVSSRLRAPDPILPPHRPPPGSYVRPPNTAPKINLLPTEQRVDEPGRYQPKPFPFPAMSGPNVPIAGTGPHPQPSLGHFPQLEEPTLGASLHPQPPAGLNPQPTSPAPPDASQWLHGGVSQMYQPKRNQLVEPLNLLPENKPMRASPGLKLAEPMSPDYGPSHFTLRQADAVQRDLMSELRKHERQNNKPMRPGEDEAMRPIAYGLKAAKKKKLKEAEAAGQLPSNLPADSIGGPSLLTQLDKANAKHELIKGVEDKVAQGAAQEQKGSGSQDLIHKLLGEQRSLHTYGSIAQSVGDVIKSPNMSRGLSAGMSGYKSADYRDANEKLKKEIDEELNVPIK